MYSTSFIYHFIFDIIPTGLTQNEKTPTIYGVFEKQCPPDVVCKVMFCVSPDQVKKETGNKINDKYSCICRHLCFWWNL